MNSDKITDTVDSLGAPAPFAPDRSRGAIGYLALAAPALVILGDTAFALARGWRIATRLDEAIAVAAGLWLLAITLLWVLPAGRRLYDRRAPQLVLLAGSACIAFFVAELAVGGVLAGVSEPFHCWRPGSKIIYRPKAGLMRDVGSEAHVSFNSWGMRGHEVPERAAAYRILCLGASSTACTYLDDAKTWPQLLEGDLQSADPSRGYWVGNASIPGFKTAEHRRFVEQSDRLGEIDCLIVQAGINDFAAVLAGPRPAPPLWSHSRVLQLARALARRHATNDTLIEDTAGTVYNRRRAARQAAEIDPNKPTLEAGLQQFSENLRAIIAACKYRNLRVIFTTQPVLWTDDLDAENAALLWFGQLENGRFLSVAGLREGMDRYNQILRSVCADCGVGLIDLAPLNGDPIVFYDDCHFTETGARLVAQLIADWLLAHPDSPDQESAP